MRRKIVTWSTLILALLMLLSIAHVAFAPVTLPLMYVDPQESTAGPGDSFTINVNVQGVTDMYSWGAKLTFNPNVLIVTSVTEGPMLKSQPAGSIFVQKVFFNYIDAGATTLGAYPGVSGDGTLMHVTFQVKDSGIVPLDLYDTKLLDSTLASMAHDVQGGSFESTSKANLVKKSAWPGKHHFVIAKHGPNQTLYGYVKNIGPTNLTVYISFKLVRYDGFVASIETDRVPDVMPGQIVQLTADFGPLTGEDVGKYAVSAKAMYSYTGIYFTPGAKNKTFSFAVVP